MAEMRNVYNILMGKPKDKGPIVRPKLDDSVISKLLLKIESLKTKFAVKS